MKCTLLLPYIDYYNTNFDVNDNYYSNGGYEQALKRNNDMYGDSIFKHMSNNILNNTNTFNTFGSFLQKSDKQEEKISYSSCDAIIYDENMKEETIDGLQKYVNSQDVFVLFVKLDFDTIEEDFETDFKMWVKSHNKINSTMMNDDWKFANEPSKNLKIKVDNFNYDLINCKILETNGDMFVILVDKIKNVI